MDSRRTQVFKFGGSVLREEADFARVAKVIRSHLVAAEGHSARIVAVMSAMHGVTDAKHARRDEYRGADRASDFIRFVAEGEIESCTKLDRELRTLGVDSFMLALEEIGILTANEALDADPVEFDPSYVRDVLASRKVALVPGHVGRDRDGNHLTLLGRGGSDLTAVMIAHGLEARCRLYKDVDGVVDAEGNRFETIQWRTLRRLGSSPIQEKAEEFCIENGMQLELGSIGGKTFTLVSV